MATVIGSLRVALGLDSAQFERGATRAQGKMRTFEQSAQQMVRALTAVGVALGATVSMRKFVDETIAMQKAQAQLAAAIESTGGAAGRSIDQLNASAAALQRVTMFGDDAVGAMQAVLLTFTQVQGPQFDAATQAILNISTAMGTNLQTAAVQVGRALNDPIAGLTGLSRAGIQFSDAQKATIRSLVEIGDVAGAQTVILAELERQFGGSAEAARETLGGALASLTNAWGDLFEIGGPAADNLRLSIEELIATITDPAFVAAFQSIGSSMFNSVNIALQAIQGLQMALQDVSYLVGWADTTWLMDEAIRSANAGMAEAVRGAQALTGELPSGVAVSKDMAAAKLDEAEAYLAAARASSAQAIGVVTQSNAYRDLMSRSVELRGDIDDLVSALGNLEALGDNPGSMIDVTAISGQIIALRLELIEAEAAAQDMLVTAGDLGPEYVAALVEVNRIRAAIADATGETVVLEKTTEGAAGAASRLSTTLAGMSMGGQAAAQAGFLAQQLGIALDVAVRLNATLDRNAGTAPAASAPRLDFGLGSTADDPLASGMANTVLGFGNVTEAADETWRAVTDLTTATTGLALAAGGGSPSGSAAGAIEEVADISEVLSDILADAEDPIQDYRDQMQGLADDIGDDVADAISSLAESGFQDFDGFMQDMVASAANAVAEITAEFATAQLSQSLGMFAGPLGAVAGGLAGGLFGGLFGGGGGQSYEGSEQQQIDQEKAALVRQQRELEGQERLIQLAELEQLDESNRALQEHIWALEDQAEAAAEAERQLAEAAAEAAAIQAQISAERLGLERELLTVMGDTEALRALQLEGLDESNRALQEQIWAEQDRAAAVDETTRVLQEAIAAITSDKYTNAFAFQRDLALAANGLLPANSGVAPSNVAPATSIAQGSTSDPVVVELQAIRAKLNSVEATVYQWNREGLPQERLA